MLKPINAILISLALLTTGCGSPPQPADAVYTNARIYTANPEQPWGEALVVKDGELLYVGDTAGATNYRGQAQYDLGGRMVLPGLIDGHVHPGFVTLFAGMLPLPDAETREAQMQDIAKLIADHPDEELVFAIGWDNNFFGTQGPHKRDLDAFESDRPVVIHDQTMHSLWANSRALALSDLGDDPLDPWPGVAYYQRDETGALSGYMTEGAALDFAASLVGMGAEQEQTLADFLADLSRDGVTTLFDAGNFGSEDRIYGAVQRLEERGELPLRYHGSYAINLPGKEVGAVTELQRLASTYNSERVRIDTLKVFFDGVVETRGAHMLADYNDMPGHRGASLLEETALLQLILELDDAELHLHVHVIGDQAARSVLDAVELAHEKLNRAPRSRITLTHLQVMDPSDYSRFAELGVIAQFTPAWHGDDRGWYEPALGDRAKKPYVVRPLLEIGEVVSFSSDVYFPSEWHDGSASPFTGIQVGHNRQYREDAPDGPRSGTPEEQLPLNVMVDGYTRHAAWQMGLESRVGMLRAGLAADFLILEENLFEVEPHLIHEQKPAAVIVDGELVRGVREWGQIDI